MSQAKLSAPPAAAGWISGLTAMLVGILLVILGWRFGSTAFLIAACSPFLAFLLSPRAALILLIAVIPSIGEVEVDRVIPFLWMLGFVPLVFAWVIALLTKPHEIDLPLIPTFCFGLVGLAALVSHFGGYDLRPNALVDHGADWPFWQCIDFFTSFAIGFIAMTVIRNESDLKNIFLVFIFTGIPYAITIFFFGHEKDPMTGVIEEGGRTQGFYGHPHMASTHMIVCAILAANYARYVTGKMRWFAIGATVLFMTTLAFASSKTTVAAMPLIIFVWGALEFGIKRAAGFTVGLILVGVLLLPFAPSSIRKDAATIGAAILGDSDPHAKTLVGQGKLNTFKERFIQVDEAIEMIKERPVIGYGPGRVTHVSLIPARFAGPQIHNYYVQVFFEMGVIGGVLFICLVLAVMTLGLFTALALRGKPVGHLVRGILLSTLMVLMILMLNSGSVGLRIIWCLLGLLAGVERLARPSSRTLSSA
ncbi:MAG: O-antigen ligase [Verrucomicrobiales bacterium]|jgi:O-antigen ligase